MTGGCWDGAILLRLGRAGSLLRRDLPEEVSTSSLPNGVRK